MSDYLRDGAINISSITSYLEEKGMTFQFQRFSAGHQIESTDIHKKAVAINN